MNIFFASVVVPAPNVPAKKEKPISLPQPQPKPMPSPAPGNVLLGLCLVCIRYERNILVSFLCDSVTKASSPFTIVQTATTSWNAKGKTYYRYSTIVTNKSAKTAKNINISISKLYGPIWGLSKAGNGYSVPTWLSSLPAGKSFEFVYIHSASPADIWVSEYTLV